VGDTAEQRSDPLCRWGWFLPKIVTGGGHSGGETGAVADASIVMTNALAKYDARGAYGSSWDPRCGQKHWRKDPGIPFSARPRSNLGDRDGPKGIALPRIHATSSRVGEMTADRLNQHEPAPLRAIRVESRGRAGATGSPDRWFQPLRFRGWGGGGAAGRSAGRLGLVDLRRSTAVGRERALLDLPSLSSINGNGCPVSGWALRNNQSRSL